MSKVGQFMHQSPILLKQYCKLLIKRQNFGVMMERMQRIKLFVCLLSHIPVGKEEISGYQFIIHYSFALNFTLSLKPLILRILG